MKLARLIGGVAALVVVGGGLAGVWTYQRATALPDWYVQEQNQPPVSPGVVPSLPTLVPIPPANDVAQPVPPQVPQAARPKSEKPKQKATGQRIEERNFHRRTLLGQSSWSSAIVASRLVFDAGKLEVSVIVAPNRIDRSQLKPREAATLDRALALAPGSGDQPIALTLADRPLRNADGALEISNNATIRLGEVGFELDSFAQRLGGQTQATRRSLNREIQRLLEPTQDDDEPAP